MSIFVKRLFVGCALVSVVACGGGSSKSGASDPSVEVSGLSVTKPCEVPDDVSELSFEGDSIYYSGASELLENQGCVEIEFVEAWDDAVCVSEESEFLMLDIKAVSDTKAEVTICGAK